MLEAKSCGRIIGQVMSSGTILASGPKGSQLEPPMPSLSWKHG